MGDQSKEAKEYSLKNEKKLICPMCENGLFWTRKSLMNTKGLTFFDLDWANKEATNYVCNNCGHVLWFLTW